MKTKAERRHLERVKRTKVLRQISTKHLRFSSEEEKAKYVGRCSATPKNCSCWMCGNQRKYFGARFSELKKLKQTETDLKTLGE